MNTRTEYADDWQEERPSRHDRRGHPGGAPPWDGHAAGKPEGIFARYGKRILSGIACSLVVYVVMHLPYIKVIILWVCQIVILIFGRPHGGERLEKWEERGREVIEKVTHSARDNDAGGSKPSGIAGVLAAVPAVKTIQEKAHAVKDVADKAKAVEQGVHKGVEKIAETGDKVADALKNAGGKARDAIGGGIGNLTEAWHARKEAQEKAARDRLIVRARTARVEVDDSWSLSRLDAEVNLAEDRAWHAKYNARCPRCRGPMWLNPRSPAWKYGDCIYCVRPFYFRAALNLGPPPRPRTR